MDSWTMTVWVAMQILRGGQYEVIQAEYLTYCPEWNQAPNMMALAAL
jgi:hypothetical protein